MDQLLIGGLICDSALYFNDQVMRQAGDNIARACGLAGTDTDRIGTVGGDDGNRRIVYADGIIAFAGLDREGFPALMGRQRDAAFQLAVNCDIRVDIVGLLTGQAGQRNHGQDNQCEDKQDIRFFQHFHHSHHYRLCQVVLLYLDTEDKPCIEKECDLTMAIRAAWAEIDLGALNHNYQEIKKQLKPGVKLCAVVKADAYGHGAVPVARAAVEAGAAYLAVATLSEGIELREAGFTTPILLLGLVLPEEAADVVAYDITQVVCDEALPQALSEAAVLQQKTAKVHLKVDTGMGRIGVRPEEIGALAAKIAALPGLEIEGVFSHFAMADSRDKAYTKMQLTKFRQAIQAVKDQGIALPICHIAESAAILEIPEAHFDMVRAGVIQYGLWPSDEVSHPIELRPLMKLQAQVVWLKTLHPGESIGYGRKFIAEKECRIATLPIGYADGYIRAYAEKGCVEIHGRRASIAGRVCMDQVMIDVTDIPEVSIGDTATLFGSETLTIDEAAGWLGTINYEIPCLIAPRVPRIYKK